LLPAALACAAIVALVPLRNYVVSGRPALLATNGMATMELLHPLTPKVNLDRVERNPIYRALKLDFSVIQMIEFVRQDPQGYLATLVPPALYTLGLPDMLEPGSPARWELLSLVGLYAAYFVGATRTTNGPRPPPEIPRERPRHRSLSRSLALSLSRKPTLLLHSFTALHFLTMVTFLPNSYGYRQVLPMYLFVAVFAAAIVAQMAVRLRSVVARPARHEQRRGGQRHPVEQYVPGASAAAGHEELA
jgi:hypothetical protein